MIKYFNFILILALTSCLSSRYPTSIKRFEGVVMSCRADSNTIKQDSEIRIKRMIQKSRTDCINCKYTGCENPPEYFGYVIHWPGKIIFKFKEREYYFLNNARAKDPAIRYGEKNFAVVYDMDFGSIDFSRKKKTLTLISTKYGVTRVYSYEYSKQDSVLLLKLIK